MEKIVVDPLTRIEGHLRFETSIENGKVVDAKCSGDMFRGIEKALIGYDARVAGQVTQRVCGVCPYAHAEAAALALESAMGIKLNKNGQLLRNLIVGAYQLQDYLLHFYILCALDFIDITDILKYQGEDKAINNLKDWVNSELKSNKIFPAAPFLPRYEAFYSQNKDFNLSAIKGYLESIEIMSDLTKMVAIFGAKAPHPVAIEAGGVTTMPTVGNIAKYTSLLEGVQDFIQKKFMSDVITTAKEFKEYFSIGKGYGNFLSFPYLPDENGENHLFVGGYTPSNGEFEELNINYIKEDHKYSYYKDFPDTNIKPLENTTMTPIDFNEYKKEHNKSNGKYSWTRSPRYKGNVVEVGPIAKVVNTYNSGKNQKLNKLVDKINMELDITISDYDSVMGRHLCRAIVSTLIMDKLLDDVQKVVPYELGFIEHEVPKNAKGYGLTEATRGGLAHFIETDDNGLIKNYDMIVPTTWNISPKDGDERPGAVEKMLLNTEIKDPKNPIELARIVRSTDPCMACSVH